jgi:hypothetical protein
LNGKFSQLIDSCQDDYSFGNEEKHNFGYNWTAYNESFVPKHGMEIIRDAFMYQSAYSLKSLPYSGLYKPYLGGGYVYKLRGELNFLKGNLSLLQQMSWIDKSTRAVFIEFGVYNPNINMFVAGTILFEFLASGNILKSARLDPLNLFNDMLGFVAVKILFDLIYIAFIAFFAIVELRAISRMGIRVIELLIFFFLNY